MANVISCALVAYLFVGMLIAFVTVGDLNQLSPMSFKRKVWLVFLVSLLWPIGLGDSFR